jgi:hypothetical protein
VFLPDHPRQSAILALLAALRAAIADQPFVKSRPIGSGVEKALITNEPKILFMISRASAMLGAR